LNLETNKNVVRDLFALLGNGHVEDALRSLDDDVKWSVQGIGTFDKNGMRGNWRQLFGPASYEGSLGIKEMTAESDRVAAEIEVDVKLTDGRDYCTTASLLLVVRDGKIVEAREYLDTAYVQRMFGAAPGCAWSKPKP
jgi:ketosteroid isomerase-like protein